MPKRSSSSEEDINQIAARIIAQTTGVHMTHVPSTNGKNPAKPVHLDPGANLRLRYGIYVHDGDTKAANVANVFRVYVAESRD